MCAAAHTLVLKALGSARQPFFSFLAQTKEGQRKALPRLGLRSSVKTGAAELSRAFHGPRPAGAASGDKQTPVCLITLLRRAQTVLALIGFDLRCSAAPRGRGHSVARIWHPDPVDAAEHRSRSREKRVHV